MSMRSISTVAFLAASLSLFLSLRAPCAEFGVLGERVNSVADEQVFDLLEKAGVEWVRLGYGWPRFEPQEGQYTYGNFDRTVAVARSHHFKILGLLGFTPKWATKYRQETYPPDDIEKWENYVYKMVSRYRHEIKYWEIMNEPDIKKFWRGSPEEYIDLLRAAHHVIKSIDSSITVISAGLDGSGEKYIDILLNQGLADVCDAIAFHPYAKTPEKSLERVKKFIAVMNRHGVQKPLWLTEIGWQAGGWREGPGFVSDEQTKARYLTEGFSLLQNYARVIFWYRSVEGPKMYGLIVRQNDKLTVMPAYYAFRDFMRHESGK